MERIGERISYCERCGLVTHVTDESIAEAMEYGSDSTVCPHCKIKMKFLDNDDILSPRDYMLFTNKAFLLEHGYSNDKPPYFNGTQQYMKDCEKKVIDEYISKLPTFDKYAMYARLEDFLCLMESNKRKRDEYLRKQEMKPKCPVCSSTNIQPISGTERAVSILGLGLFSKKINKSHKCLDCKHTW